MPPRADLARRISVTQPFDKCLIEFSAPILWRRRKDLYEFTEDYPNTLKMGQNNVTIFFSRRTISVIFILWIFYGYWKTRSSCFILFYVFRDIGNIHRHRWHQKCCTVLGKTKHNFLFLYVLLLSLLKRSILFERSVGIIRAIKNFPLSWIGVIDFYALQVSIYLTAAKDVIVLSRNGLVAPASCYTVLHRDAASLNNASLPASQGHSFPPDQTRAN